MSVICAFGMQWGDEGKGRIVDLLAAKTDVVVRYQGGANAGHTVVVGDEKYVLHLLPSGVIQPSTVNVIANGVVVDPWVLHGGGRCARRTRGIPLDGRLLVSDRAHVVLPYHRLHGPGAWRRCGATPRSAPPAAASVRPTATSRCATGCASPTCWRSRDCADRLLGNVVARNEILERAGLELLDPDAVLDDAQAIAERLRPYVTDTTAVAARRVGGRAGHPPRGRAGLRPGRRSRHLPVRDLEQHRPGRRRTGHRACRPRPSTASSASSRPTRRASAPGPSRRTTAGAAGRHLAERGREFGATTGRPRAVRLVRRRAGPPRGPHAGRRRDRPDEARRALGPRAAQVGTAYELDGRRIDAPPALRRRLGALPARLRDLRRVGRRRHRRPALRRPARRGPGLRPRPAGPAGVPVEMISVGAERECVIETAPGRPGLRLDSAGEQEAA